jgi:hypothetical protein
MVPQFLSLMRHFYYHQTSVTFTNATTTRKSTQHFRQPRIAQSKRGKHTEKVSTSATPQRLPLGEIEDSTVFAPYQALKRSTGSSECFLMLNTLSFANTRASRLYSFSS